MTIGHGKAQSADQGSKTSWRGWFVGIIIAAALIITVLHFGEIKTAGLLFRRARPAWLVLAIGLQLLTYASLALGWELVLRRAGTAQRFQKLIRIAVIKLFADQALPTAGMGGNVLLVDRLIALGVSRGAAVATLLMSMIGFYAAYAGLAVVMLVMLWFQGHATPLMVGLVTSFLLVAFAIPSLALWLRHRGRQPLPPRIERIDFIRRLMDTVSQAPSDLLADKRLIAGVAGLNALIFLEDSGTLFAGLHALGQPTGIGTAFIALMMASIVVTLGPIPLGLGSFEVTATTMLGLLGVPLVAAFAATLIFRALSLWFPLAAGLVLMRKTMGPR